MSVFLLRSFLTRWSCK